MKRVAKLVWTSAVGLTVACTSPTDPQMFSTGDPDSLKRAEELALRALHRDPSLLAGIEQVNVRAIEIDMLGRAHAHVAQTVDGVPVFGAEAIVHLAADGKLAGVTDRFAREITVDGRPAIGRGTAIATAVTASVRSPEQLTTSADLQVLRRTGKDRLTYRVQLDYVQGGEHFRPVVFVDAKDSSVVWSYDNLQTARNREVHNLNHGTTLPGPVARTEGGAATGDVDVDTNYDRLGSTYDCYAALFGRDSFDNAGAKLISSVHYSNNYVNAFWNGTQMVYGDGDNVNSRSLAISMDVTAHELTHAVTERTSNLIYAGESGGLNEAMSDIFGNVCEWYRDTNGNVNGPTSNNTWMVGEDIWLASPALRYMSDPFQDGVSLDFYTSSAGNVDVHYSSGIANLAFYLAAHGGTHPRGKSTTVVTGIGIYDAARIFYLANTAHLTPSATFGDARVATITAATALFGAASSQVTQIGNAWTAVGVAPPPDYQVIDTRTNLSAGTGAGLAFSYPSNGASAIKFTISGGTGDADLHVKFGSVASRTNYDCRPYTSGNSEVCEFNPAQSGTYSVWIDGYAAYTGVVLTVSAAGAAPTAETACADGLDNDGDGTVDCDDSDCDTAPNCQVPTTETSCTDGIDNDADGETDCADSDCTGNPSCAVTWTVLSSTDFETNLGTFADGGADAARYRSTQFSASGRYSVQLRDNTGVEASIFSAAGIPVTAYSTLRIQYSAIAIGMEATEDYFVEIQRDNGAWVTVEDLVVGTSFSNNVRHTRDLQVPLTGAASVKVRFRCDASSNSDAVYVDDVSISAR